MQIASEFHEIFITYSISFLLMFPFANSTSLLYKYRYNKYITKAVKLTWKMKINGSLLIKSFNSPVLSISGNMEKYLNVICLY